MSFQYQGGPVIVAPHNLKAFEWSTGRLIEEDRDKDTRDEDDRVNRGTTLTALEQTMTVGSGKNQRRVEASFDARRRQTVIVSSSGDRTRDDDDHSGRDDQRRKEAEGESQARVHARDRETRVVKPGLVLLRLAIIRGSLSIEYGPQ